MAIREAKVEVHDISRLAVELACDVIPERLEVHGLLDRLVLSIGCNLLLELGFELVGAKEDPQVQVGVDLDLAPVFPQMDAKVTYLGELVRLAYRACRAVESLLKSS